MAELTPHLMLLARMSAAVIFWVFLSETAIANAISARLNELPLLRIILSDKNVRCQLPVHLQKEKSPSSIHKHKVLASTTRRLFKLVAYAATVSIPKAVRTAPTKASKRSVVGNCVTLRPKGSPSMANIVAITSPDNSICTPRSVARLTMLAR